MKTNWIIVILLSLFISSCTTSQKLTVYTIGDSTMANKPNPEENPERGWAQMLPQFFKDNVVIDNRAVNGRSTRSFIDEKRWESVNNLLKKGDYVFIQFGHNDQKETDPKRYTNPHTAFRNNLILFIKETLQKGATPILFSPIIRRNFNKEGSLIDTHGEYPMEARMISIEYNIPFIDLQYLTEKLEESYGVEASKELHLHYKVGEINYFPEGKEDNTHLSVKGATEIAKIVIIELKLLNIPLSKKIKKSL
jgi:lysophospholipase L1-like esterase